MPSARIFGAQRRSDLTRLLRPRSIVVLGSVWAENVIAQCDKIGFSGQIWPVHPKRTEIAGRQCFATLDDLPGVPDAAFVGVNRHASIEVVRQLAEIGTGGAICFASGWAEAGASDLQADLVAAAGHMPILGPNCYGMINMLDGAVIWPDQHGCLPCDTGVAILSQSSNIAINLTMQARGLPIAYVACLGNAAQVGMADLARAMLDDPRVTALGIYAEGFDDAAALALLAQEARQAGKGIVVLKAGKSEAGAAAAASHTAALAGGAAASQAFLRQAGIGDVSNLSEFIETLKILHVHGYLPGRQVCSLSCSGGEAGLVADLAEGFELNFPILSEDQQGALTALLGPLVTLSNPLDYHTFIWGDGPTTTQVFAETLAPFDAGLFVIDPPRSDRCDPQSFQPALAAICAAGEITGKPAFAVSTLPENFDEAWARTQMQQGQVALCGLETALGALQAASTPAGGRDWQPWLAYPECATQMLDEADGKALLSQMNVTVPMGRAAVNLADLRSQMSALQPPLALKGLGFAHKTEAGAVRLGLQDLDGATEMPGATGYLIEEMVQDGIAEMLIGLRRDPVYGATVTLGFGGVQAELLADIQTLVLPVNASDIRGALDRLRLSPLLDGYRGRPQADTESIVQTVLKLQKLMATDPAIVEVEINPLIVCQNGAVAVDALIRKEKP